MYMNNVVALGLEYETVHRFIYIMIMLFTEAVDKSIVRVFIV